MAEQVKRGRGRPKGSVNQPHPAYKKIANKVAKEAKAKTPEQKAEAFAERNAGHIDISDFPDMPLEQLLWVTRKLAARGDWRGVAATANMAAPYLHAKKASVEITGDMANPLAVAAVTLDKHEYQEIAKRLLDEV